MSEQLEVADIQGMIASGYLHLPWSAYLFFQVDPDAADVAARWLGQLAITTAEGKDDVKSLNVAFTYDGLKELGVGKRVLDTFSVPFIDGMASKRRRRLLGDPAMLDWGGPQVKPVDVLLMAFAPKQEVLVAGVAGLTADAKKNGLTRCRELYGQVFGDRREHFGFVDGISQPIIEGLPKASDLSPDARDVVKSGEFVLGYTNEYGYRTDAPALGRYGNLGKNGSYLVFRETSQDVAGFWKALDTKANGDPVLRDTLAAKMIGRWKSGAPLVKAPEADDPAFVPRASPDRSNDFGFEEDPQGFRCPLGAHIRRANPRDGSLHTQASKLPAFSVRHRLLRRGRSYGTKYNPKVPDNTERGLHFIALCGDLERQFEFVQQTWINNAAFNDLDEVDPLVGGQPAEEARATFTIQANPVRRRLPDMQSFVKLIGGAYFFLPSIAAIRWLGDPNRQ
jgi:Dyp-type peroxidase family